MSTYQLKQKIWSLNDSYYIKTAEGTPQYQISGKFLSWGKNLTIRDMAGTEVLKIKQVLMSFTPTFELYKDNKQVASITKTGWFGKTYELDIPGPNDYTIKGDFWEKEFNFLRQKKVVAKVTKKGIFSPGNYGVKIFQEDDHDLILATVIVLDLSSKDN